MTFCESQSTRVGSFSKGVVRPNPPQLPPSHKHTENPLSCNAEWTKKYRTGRKERKKDLKNDCKTLTLFLPKGPLCLSSYIFSLSLPSTPQAFLSRHASVPANQHRPWQDEEARKEQGRKGRQTKEHCCNCAGVLGRVDTRLEGCGWRGTDGERVWLRRFIIKNRD